MSSSRHPASTPRAGRRAVLLLVLVLASGVASSASTRAGEGASDEPRDLRMAQYDPEQSWMHDEILVLGSRVFDNRCSPCHGVEGFGDGELADVLAIRPRNYHTEPFKWGASPSKIATTIAGGRSGIMPPFGTALSEKEVWAVAYVVWRWIPEDQRSYDTPEEARSWKLP